MKTRILLSVLVVFALVIPALAQNATGKWTGESQGRGGPQPITLELKADGAKLTGKFTQGQAPAADIADGKVEGGKISFSVTRNFNGNEFKLNYSGEVKGDELTITPEAPAGGGGGGGGRGGRGGGPITLKRS